MIYSWDSGAPDPDSLLIFWVTLGLLLTCLTLSFLISKAKPASKISYMNGKLRGLWLQ